MIEDVQNGVALVSEGAPRERKPNAGAEATAEHSLVLAAAGRGAFSVTFRVTVQFFTPGRSATKHCLQALWGTAPLRPGSPPPPSRSRQDRRP